MNENDREMLELAATAAGYEWHVETSGQEFQVLVRGGLWNPLTDDGDLFLLQVALRLELEFGTDFVSVGKSYGNDGEWHLATEFGGDLRAAARRAIFRAAAEIGRQKKAPDIRG